MPSGTQALYIIDLRLGGRFFESLYAYDPGLLFACIGMFSKYLILSHPEFDEFDFLNK